MAIKARCSFETRIKKAKLLLHYFIPWISRRIMGQFFWNFMAPFFQIVSARKCFQNIMKLSFFRSLQKKAKVKFGLLSSRIEKFFNIFISVTSAQKLLEKGNSMLEICVVKDAKWNYRQLFSKNITFENLLTNLTSYLVEANF